MMSEFDDDLDDDLDFEHEDESPYRVPESHAQLQRPQSADGAGEGDSTGGLIPYKNPQALIAYYLGLFSLFPLLGFFLAVPAFVLGIIGLKNRRRNPAVKGSVHAWIGIVMGAIFTVVWGLVIVALILTLVFNNPQRR